MKVLRGFRWMLIINDHSIRIITTYNIYDIYFFDDIERPLQAVQYIAYHFAGFGMEKSHKCESRIWSRSSDGTCPTTMHSRQVCSLPCLLLLFCKSPQPLVFQLSLLRTLSPEVIVSSAELSSDSTTTCKSMTPTCQYQLMAAMMAVMQQHVKLPTPLTYGVCRS